MVTNKGHHSFTLLNNANTTATQGAGEGVDSGQKMPTSETCVLGWDMHGDQCLLVPFCVQS